MDSDDLVPSNFRDARDGQFTGRITVLELSEHHAVFDNSIVTIFREVGVFGVRSGPHAIGRLDLAFAPMLAEGFDRWGVDELPGRFSLDGGPHVSADLYSYAERKGVDLNKGAPPSSSQAWPTSSQS